MSKESVVVCVAEKEKLKVTVVDGNSSRFVSLEKAKDVIRKVTCVGGECRLESEGE